MFIIERTDSDGDIVFWEMSKAVPRNAAGEPLKQGVVKREGGDTWTCLGQRDTLDVIVNFLKSRSKFDIRVTEVERAFKAAQSGGASPDRRVRPTRQAASRGVKYGRPAPSESKASAGLPIGKIIIGIVVLFGILYAVTAL